MGKSKKRSFWKMVAAFANEQLAKEDVTADQYVGVMNELHAIRGHVDTAIDALLPSLKQHIETEVAAQFRTAGPLIVRGVVEQVDRRFSDNGVVMREMLVDRNDDLKESIFRREALLDNSISKIEPKLTHYQQTIVTVFDRVETASLRRHTALRSDIEAIAKQAGTFDLANADRYLAMLEDIRKTEQRLSGRMSYVDNTLDGVSSNLNDLEATVGRLAELIHRNSPSRKPHYDSAPTLPWLIDNMEELIAMCKIMDNFGEYDMGPKDTTLFQAVKALRKLNLYSALDVRDELQAWVIKRDTAAEARLRLAA